jgi:hypothetical protein
MDLPQAIKAFWDTNGTLPELYFQHAPAKTDPPVSVFRPYGFNRKRLNAGFKYDTHRYEFTVIDTDAVAAYETGFVAMDYIQTFSPSGIIGIVTEPDSYATPTETGQAHSWQFKFKAIITITPS